MKNQSFNMAEWIKDGKDLFLLHLGILEKDFFKINVFKFSTENSDVQIRKLLYQKF